MNTPDKLNEIYFHLTTRDSEFIPGNSTVTLDANVVKDIVSAILETENGTGLQTIVERSVEVKSKAQIILRSAEKSISDEIQSI